LSRAAFYMMPREMYGRVSAALEESGLSTAGLDDPDVALFGMSDYRGLIGFAGMQGRGSDRLLRSLVILPHRRGEGLGRELVDRLEVRAVLDAKRLHLLTESAAPFFRGLGFRDADRTAAPPEIAGTDQFRSLCPASAAYLVKDLR
jgi:N-acetylglutamate synthase-like GNAT family acetyltransferase